MAPAVNAAQDQQSVAGEIATAVKHSFIYGIGGFLVKGISFFLLPLYTHYLNPKDYGIFEVLDLSTSLLGMFLNFGITAALLRFYGIANTEAEKRSIVSSLFWFTVGTSAVVLLIGGASVRQTTNLLLGAGTPASYLLLSLLAFLMAYIANVPYTSLRAKEASVTIVTIDMLVTIGLLAFNIYFIAGVRLSILGLFLSKIIVNTVAFIMILKWMSRELFGAPDWKLLRKMVGFGAPLVFSNLTMFTLNFSDRFFLQHLRSLEVVGIYAVGYKFGFMLNFLLIQPFNMMWQSRMYIVHRMADHQKVFSRVFVLYSAVLIFASLGMAVLGPELMRVMVDSRYRAGGAVIPLVSLSYVFLGMGYYLQLGMFLTLRTGLIGKVSICAAILNLTANYFLIKHFGMLGAAWATVIGFLAIAVGSYCYSERVYPLALPAGRVIRALAMAGAVYLLSRVLPDTPLAVTLLWKCALLTVFPFLLWLSGCFSRDEIATLHSLRATAMAKTLRLLKPAWMRISA